MKEGRQGGLVFLRESEDQGIIQETLTEEKEDGEQQYSSVFTGLSCFVPPSLNVSPSGLV